MATDKTRYKDVKVRIPEEELAVLNCRVAKTGMSREQYIRCLITGLSFENWMNCRR